MYTADNHIKESNNFAHDTYQGVQHLSACIAFSGVEQVAAGGVSGDVTYTQKSRTHDKHAHDHTRDAVLEEPKSGNGILYN